jgi:hypothetical protein
VAPERIETDGADCPTDDVAEPDDALSDAEWEAVESMGNLREFVYDKWADVSIQGQIVWSTDGTRYGHHVY